jgi:hypothetical protein
MGAPVAGPGQARERPAAVLDGAVEFVAPEENPVFIQLLDFGANFPSFEDDAASSVFRMICGSRLLLVPLAIARGRLIIHRPHSALLGPAGIPAVSCRCKPAAM